MGYHKSQIGVETSTKVYTISELNFEVQSYLRQRYPNTIWVQGEIKNYNRNAHKDHIFFELCEKDPESERILARITAVVFEGVKPRIEASLGRVEAGFQLQDDIEVKFECVVDLYPPSGSYQLRIVDIDPYYTMGKIAQQRYAILEALKKEGLLEKNKELPVPMVPLTIGLVTSYNSAAYHDFLKELSESGYAFQIYHVNTHMQGQWVEPEVCRAIELLNRQQVDVIAIVRGGGSRSDMAWFDSLKISGAIAQSRIPVFTGLGHEIDLSVTDLVAHTYKKTPTAVAQYLVGLVSGFLEKVDHLENEILQRGTAFIQEKKRCIIELERGLVLTSRQGLQKARRTLQQTAWQTQHSHNRMIRQTLLQLRSASERIGLKSVLWLKNSNQEIIQQWEWLQKSLRSRIQNTKSRFELLQIRCNAADPIQVLKRGFTLSLDSRGKTIRRLGAVRTGDVLTTVLVDGQAKSRVTEKYRLQDHQDPLKIERALL